MFNYMYIFGEEAFLSYNLLFLSLHFEDVVNAFLGFLYIDGDMRATSLYYVGLDVIESNYFITTA